MAKLARLDLYRLAVPLTTPYRLSFTKLDHFDTVMVRAEDGDGRSGWGESTLLTGYTEESVENVRIRNLLAEQGELRPGHIHARKP